MQIDHPQSDAIRTLGKLIDHVEVAMLTTVAPDGTLVSRPLQTLQMEFDGDLWFITGADSGKVADMARDSHVNLAYADPDDHTYVSVSGHAQVLVDRAKLDELWSDRMERYFPRGKDDPDLALIKVHVDSAEYWTGAGTLTMKLLEIASQITPPDRPIPGATNQRIELPHQH